MALKLIQSKQISANLTGSLFGTASYASSIGPLTQDVSIVGNLNVIGTSSFTYSTASIVQVGSNTILLNTDNPATRFGGITVVDSGSFGNSSTGSIFWDSLQNRWIYSNPSGSSYDGGMLISGPRNTSGIGNEQGTTLNALMKGQGGDHITSSGIFEVSGSVGIGTSTPANTLDVNGTARVSGAFTGGAAITATTSVTANNGNGFLLTANTLTINGTGNYVRFNHGFSAYNGFIFEGYAFAQTTGETQFLQLRGSFAPTSGTATFSGTNISPTINQTGGANGITRGLYINPTLTAAADFRAIETTSGSVMLNTTSGNTLIGTTTDTGYKLRVNGTGAGLYVAGANSAPFTQTIASFVYGGNGNSINIENQSGKASIQAREGIVTMSLQLNPAGGNVLIGHTTDAGYKLLVTGSATSGSLNVSNALYVSGGNVGIGTSSPSASLHISGASSAALLQIDSPASSSIVFVSGSGTVGIGTTTPTNTLDIQSAGTGSLRISGSGGSQITLVRPTAGLTGFIRYVGATMELGTSGADPLNLYTSNTARISIDTSGNVGIGRGTATPLARLYVSGASASTLFQIDSPASSSIVFVSGSGNIGINTATPAYNLDVNGTARVSDISYLTLGARIGTTTTAAGIFPSGTSGRESLNLRSSLLPTDTGNDVVITNGQGDVGNTSSIRSLLTVARSFSPTSGTGIYNLIQVNPTINQTGGANGITRGLYINPTLTSAADFRAIETTQGRNIFTDTYAASGSANSGSLLDLNQTWNTTGTPIAIKLNVTDTASNSLSDLMSLQVGGSARFRILKSGYFVHNTGGEIAGSVIIGSNVVTPSARLQLRGAGATSATTTLLIQNSTPTNLLSINDIGQVAFTSPTMSLAASQSAFSISPIISASAVIGGQYYGVNITPTFFQTTGSQTETAFRVAATYTGSSAAATGGTNIIADFGSTSAGSQLTVTDVTSGSIYMVNDVSGLPIIEATSDWGVKIYDFPRVVLEKTGSAIIISGSLTVNSGSLTMPSRPAFRVSGSASTDRTSTVLSGSAVGIDYNQGGYYNNTTGIFTAPIAGLYNVYMNVRCGSVNAQQQVIMYKNSTPVLMWESSTNTGPQHFGVSGIVNLAVNDTLKVQVVIGSIQFDSNDSWGAAYIG